jgi:hypothetical protein
MHYCALVRSFFGLFMANSMDGSMSRDVLLRLINRPPPEHPAPAAPTPAPVLAPTSIASLPPAVPGAKYSQMLVGGGYVILFEMRPDQTAGEILSIPVEEFHVERAEKFERYVRRKQLRRRMQLVK